MGDIGSMEKGPILVIDDDPGFREVVTSVLTKAGFKVLAAPDGPKGIVMARASQPVVILVDMMMPDMDGIETCERLKLDPGLEDIPLVGVTGSADLMYTAKAFRAGVQFFLPKPSGVESLLQVVELAADSGRADSAMQHTRRHLRFPVELPVSCLVRGDGGRSREIEVEQYLTRPESLRMAVPSEAGRPGKREGDGNR